MLDAGGVIIEKAREDAAEALEASPEDTAFDDGVFTAAGTNRSVTLEEVVRMKSENNSPHPYDFKHTYAASGSTFPHGCHIAEIEVDAVTMRAKLTRFTVVMLGGIDNQRAVGFEGELDIGFGTAASSVKKIKPPATDVQTITVKNRSVPARNSAPPRLGPNAVPIPLGPEIQPFARP